MIALLENYFNKICCAISIPPCPNIVRETENNQCRILENGIDREVE